MARNLRMLGDGTHKGSVVPSRDHIYDLEDVPLESIERYTQGYAEAMGHEVSPESEEFASPSGCPCNSTF